MALPIRRGQGRYSLPAVKGFLPEAVLLSVGSQLLVLLKKKRGVLGQGETIPGGGAREGEERYNRRQEQGGVSDRSLHENPHGWIKVSKPSFLDGILNNIPFCVSEKLVDNVEVTVQKKSRRKAFDASETLFYLRCDQYDREGVVVLGQVSLHRGLIIVGGDGDNLKMGAVFVVDLLNVGQLMAAMAAPGGPKNDEDLLALELLQGDLLAIDGGQGVLAADRREAVGSEEGERGESEEKNEG